MEDDHYHVDEERPALPSFPSHASFRRRNPLVDEHGLPVRPILAPSQRGNGVYHRLQRRPFELDPIQNPCGVLAHALMLCLSTNKNRSDACAVHERKMNECNARFRATVGMARAAREHHFKSLMTKYTQRRLRK
eukprot:TRINITY_DN4217_c1_g1_i1.p1 TRINITY_DN4217_c1_g1~~TRINITY_DN4217_c1_g1_i1.p1  ORF type:complete len:154 (+),score=9.04 TRINITY_DN4217_c1_g1_i1:61-462(+)